MRRLLLLALFWLPLRAAETNVVFEISWEAQPLDSTNTCFVVLGSYELSAPLTSWTVLTNCVGTNHSVKIMLSPARFYVTGFESNVWGVSPFTNIVWTPAPPVNRPVKMQRAD